MFLKTTIAAAALTVLVAAPAFASSGDTSFGIDDRYSLATEWDLPQAQGPAAAVMPAPVANMHRVHYRHGRIARYERHLNMQDQTGR